MIPSELLLFVVSGVQFWLTSDTIPLSDLAHSARILMWQRPIDTAD